MAIFDCYEMSSLSRREMDLEHGSDITYRAGIVCVQYLQGYLIVTMQKNSATSGHPALYSAKKQSFQNPTKTVLPNECDIKTELHSKEYFLSM